MGNDPNNIDRDGAWVPPTTGFFWQGFMWTDKDGSWEYNQLLSEWQGVNGTNVNFRMADLITLDPVEIYSKGPGNWQRFWHIYGIDDVNVYGTLQFKATASTSQGGRLVRVVTPLTGIIGGYNSEIPGGWYSNSLNYKNSYISAGFDGVFESRTNLDASEGVNTRVLVTAVNWKAVRFQLDGVGTVGDKSSIRFGFRAVVDQEIIPATSFTPAINAEANLGVRVKANENLQKRFLKPFIFSHFIRMFL